MDNVTLAVSHFVRPGHEEAFKLALQKIIGQAKKFDGYEGIQIIAPEGNSENEYLLLVRFDNEKNYRNWEQSEIRRSWKNELQNYVQKESEVKMLEGLEFWFTPTYSANQFNPPKWKMVVLTWIVIYPLILIFSTLAGVYLSFMHPFGRMLIVSLILVTAMTYLIMPTVTRIFSSWIHKY